MPDCVKPGKSSASVRTVAGTVLRGCAAPVAVLLLLTALLGGILPGLAQEVSIKVLVNDDPISDYDIDQRERFLAITTQQQPSPALKKQATDMLIDERLQLQEGKRLGVTADEADVTKILDDMASKNNLSVDGLATALGKAGVNIKTLKDRIRAQIVWQDAIGRKFRREVQIADADIDKAVSEAGAASGDKAENALQLRQVKFVIPAGCRPKDHCRTAGSSRGSACPLRILRRARQGRERRQCENAGGSAASLSGATRSPSGDECQSWADDPAHDLSGGRRALRRLRQAYVQGRRRGPPNGSAQIDVPGIVAARRAAVARYSRGGVHRISLEAVVSC